MVTVADIHSIGADTGYFTSYLSGKRFGRGAITCKLVAEMLVNAGLTDILTMDLHHKEIQGGNTIA